MDTGRPAIISSNTHMLVVKMNLETGKIKSMMNKISITNKHRFQGVQRNTYLLKVQTAHNLYHDIIIHDEVKVQQINPAKIQK